MDLRFLQSFLRVAETGSMAAAARDLGVTPAAVAQRIQALEAEFGVPLLVRAGRRMRPTQGGSAILSPARDLLRGAGALRALAAGSDLVGVLRVGAISTALTGLLPAILKRFVALAPRVDTYVVPGSSAELFRKLSGEEIDAAILVDPQFVLPKTLEWRLLREEPLVVLAPAALANEAPGDLLRREPLIRYDRNHWGGRLADAYLRRLRIRPTERLELDSLEAIAVMVGEGLGVSIVPDWAPPWPEGLSVAKLALEPGAPRRRVGLVWPRASQKQVLLETFARAAVNDPPGP